MTEPSNNMAARLNEDRRRRFGTSGRPLALVCECGDRDCLRTVLLSPDEYDTLRPAAVLHPEHVSPIAMLEDAASLDPETRLNG